MGNANSGRRPNPTALHVLRGNPSRRRLNDREPQPARAEESFDTPPDELTNDSRAIAEWERLVPMMRVSGLISTAERSTLIGLCKSWSTYLDAMGKVRKDGPVIPGKGAVPVINPWLKVADQALSQCTRLWSELGLTPSSRSRVAALPVGANEPAQPKTKWGGLLP